MFVFEMVSCSSGWPQPQYVAKDDLVPLIFLPSTLSAGAYMSTLSVLCSSGDGTQGNTLLTKWQALLGHGAEHSRQSSWSLWS